MFPLLEVFLTLAAVSSVAGAKRTGKVDYVIIGGGPAGFIVAEQLSRNVNVNIIPLEAGPDSSLEPVINDSSRMLSGVQKILLTKTSARSFHRGGCVYFGIKFTARS